MYTYKYKYKYKYKCKYLCKYLPLVQEKDWGQGMEDIVSKFE